MISLAPLKYRSILADAGGPVQKMLSAEIAGSNGKTSYEAAAYLKLELRPDDLIENKLYGNPDGTGTDNYKSIACYKAISEALERWAYYETCNGVSHNNYGFDIDPTTTGMAAFPGLTKNAARSIAFQEALERWALVEWWLGNLQSTSVSTTHLPNLVITIPNVGSVAIIWQQLQEFADVTAYGFAGGKNIKQAISKAQIELDRNIFLLNNYFRNSNRMDVNQFHIQEQRVLWFASPEGHNSFLNRVSDSQQKSEIIHIPELILDQSIDGPWNSYATAWRCLFKATTPFAANENRLDFFMF